MQQITPCLWFDTEAEEAALFYTSLFPHSRIIETTYYPKAAEEASGKAAGSVLTVEFELNGQPFTALNGGTNFKLTEAISFQIFCKDQVEIDHYWDGLISAGGEESQCGWLKDRFGVSWQVVPENFNELMKKNPEKVTEAFMPMKKLIIADIEAAAEN